MKYKAGEIDWSKPEEEQVEGFVEEKMPTVRGKKWYDFIPFEKIKELLPRLKNVRGPKVKIQFDGFKITSDNNKTIFERNKSFGSRSQVDFMAWYIGSKFLEVIYFKMDGFSKTKLSRELESKEAEFRLYDDMKTIKETFRYYVEQYLEEFITEADLMSNGQKLLETLDNISAKNRMAKIFDDMMSPEAINKTTATLKKRGYREFQAKVKGFKVFSNVSDT
jgi:hypothetical protein